MPIRPFGGIQTLTGSAQPCFGTTATAAFTPPPDKFANSNGPGTNQTQVTIAVTSTRGFVAGDQVAVGPASAFVPASATVAQAADVGEIKQVVDATHLLVQGLSKAHANGEFVILNEVVGNVHIIPVGGTANDKFYLGNSSSVAAGDASVFDVLYAPGATGPTYVHDSEAIGASQPLTTTSYWIIGTAADTFCARFTQL